MIWTGIATTVAGAGLQALAGALAGPEGPRVVNRIAKELRIDSTDPEVVNQALQADPGALAALRKVELEESKLAAEQAERRIAADEQSTQNAREAHKDSPFPMFYTVIVMLIFAAALVGLFFIEIPSTNQDLVNIILGALITMAVAAGNFWVGSSRGSASKEKAMIENARARR